MKKQYLIYSDESYKKGSFYSNFYGGALLDYTQLEKISKMIEDKKVELNLLSEVKWSKVTAQYLSKYIELIDYFFALIADNKIKIRIMFRQNAHVPNFLSKEQLNNSYFLLYYQFIKHSFGLDYCNKDAENNTVFLKLYLDQIPDTKEKARIFKEHILNLNNVLNLNNIFILPEDITEINSKNHVILQCMDIILGSMNFKLNSLNKIKNAETNKRGKTTIAKEKLYKVILYNIREIYPGFNIGITTGMRGNVENRWLDPYRHWNFIAKDSTFNPKLTKKKLEAPLSLIVFQQ